MQISLLWADIFVLFFYLCVLLWPRRIDGRASIRDSEYTLFVFLFCPNWARPGQMFARDRCIWVNLFSLDLKMCIRSRLLYTQANNKTSKPKKKTKIQQINCVYAGRACCAHCTFYWVYLQFGDMQRSSKNAHERTNDTYTTAHAVCVHGKYEVIMACVITAKWRVDDNVCELVRIILLGCVCACAYMQCCAG